jgi:prophage DNA circulation protein
MSWRDQLRPASFRGVPFLVESSEQKLGRRAVQTEYPGRDEPFPEDMGRRAWGDSISAFLVGDDHLEEAKRLAEALNRYGPGELVHPYIGTRLVQIGEVSLRQTTREGGLSTFTIEAMEAAPAKTPAEYINTDTALQQSCDKAEQSLLDEFEAFFNVEGMSQGLVDELAVAYDKTMEFIAPAQDLWARGQSLWAKGQGYISWGQSQIATGQAWVGRVQGIINNFSDPQALGGGLFYGLRDLLGVFGHVGAKGSAKNSILPIPTAAPKPSAEQVLDVLRRLPKTEKTRVIPVNQTPSRTEQVRMQGALLDLSHSATVIAAAQTSSLIEYRDQLQAERAQEAFIAAIEQAELNASDTVYQALERVKIDLIKDLDSRGAGLPSVTKVIPQHTLPALVQAYRLYSDSTRDVDLIERNQLQHPGFIPAGEPLEVVQ